jgi:hypothetical protein
MVVGLGSTLRLIIGIKVKSWELMKETSKLTY